MAAPSETGRARQRRRTRKALLQAAARLLQQGRPPTLDEVAEEALVSRATAYRYFPSIDALMVEAALDVASPSPERLFDDGAERDPVARLHAVDAAMAAMIAANEVPLRLMLANALERAAKGGGAPVRQNRRTPLIEAALAPAAGAMDSAALERLTAALALVIGTESMIVFRDVLQLDDDKAAEVRRWAIEALVEAAIR